MGNPSNRSVSSYGKYLVVMNDDGSLYAYCAPNAWRQLYVNDGCKIPPYRFRGDECVTAECFPDWVVDAYYVDELPNTSENFCGR